ncbi:lateral signaling target protein 2 homolog [Mizuhopecten yessoensis]|uniref:Lateral signaling target protein 2-like n=1 Tax=Mizuhopecten yessoensis TaxID=6573 RepID=A0A210PPE6_MIZYE|nr:lateral signaling target protein 2 homolog [Mizuhopecten yessoensis]OWF38353.1 Lateral signaling target protein 2-like [Mizuhopecten yessoensis]
MNSLRRWLYKPKKTDTSLLAKFFFADEELNFVAAELDSFDGRKDPERCTTLVNKLRNCQDKVLVITQKVIDEAVGNQKASRDYRVKFPDDVQQENLAGQLWFGAECLAAGSSIMNREVESASMRPLARALTKNLDSLRTLLREQCLRNINSYTERIKEALIIFDKLFAEFELRYVSAMVPVKSMKDYDLLQEITVLFSETVQRALKQKLLSQDMIDDYDPALMFTIPRLAMISGLLVFPEGPLNPDMQPSNMSEMFRPFQTLLLKIRDLLYTLSQRELLALEKALCSADEPETSTSTLTSRISQTDAGFEDSLDPTGSSLFPDGSVKLEDLGNILHHTSNSGSPVTPITPVIDPGTSDFPVFPSTSQSMGQYNTQDQDASPTGTLISSLEEKDESFNSSLNKSESRDSGLHSENVSTSDTVLVDTGAVVNVSDTNSSDQASGYASSDGRSHDKTSTSSAGDDAQNVCMKSCCFPENDVYVLCRHILDEMIDQVLEGLSEQSPQFKRHHSCPYNLDFEIPRISITELHPDNQPAGSKEMDFDFDPDESSDRQKLYDSNWENCESPANSSNYFDMSGPCDKDQNVSSARICNDKTCDNCSTPSNSTVPCANTCDIYVACPSCSKKRLRCDTGNGSSGDTSSSDSSGSGISVENICNCDQGPVNSADSDCSLSDHVCNCDPGTGGSLSRHDASGHDTDNTCDHTPRSTCQHSSERPSSSTFGHSQSSNRADHSPARIAGVSSENRTLVDRPRSPLPRPNRSSIHTKTKVVVDSGPRDQTASTSGSNTLEMPRIQRLRYTDSVSSSYSSCLSNNENEWDSSEGSSETSSYNSECPDEEEIALAIQAAEIASRTEARSRFSSSGDLIHRLFVCIAGVADQLQTNYAGDLRHILKCVFAMNSSEPPSVEEHQGKSTSPRIIHTGVQDPPREHRHRSTPHRHRHRRTRVREPPSWVPDDHTIICTSCKTPFTFVRRRHHCRNCGKIFCSRCSANAVPLPHYGQINPVRVCNRCFMFQVTPFTVASE